MLTWEPAQSSCEFPPCRTMSEHGFLKPNPVLFDLERLKPRAQLGHELGQGAPCGQCGHKCSGFELHFWKKVCQNCRCGKIEHGVLDREDPGQFFVGKIFDRYAHCIIVWLTIQFAHHCFQTPENSRRRAFLYLRRHSRGGLWHQWLWPKSIKMDTERTEQRGCFQAFTKSSGWHVKGVRTK